MTDLREEMGIADLWAQLDKCQIDEELKRIGKLLGLALSDDPMKDVVDIVYEIKNRADEHVEAMGDKLAWTWVRNYQLEKQVESLCDVIPQIRAEVKKLRDEQENLGLVGGAYETAYSKVLEILVKIEKENK